MKIVNAVWEKRNLGVSCNEITIEIADTINNLNESIITLESEYTVIKVPSDMYEISTNLQEKGYIFVETVINCFNSAKLPELNSIQKRIVDSISYSEMNDNDLKGLWREVENNMFETDRISMDSHFEAEQASKRYIGWIKDELMSGSKIYKLIFKENIVGFFILKENENNIFTAVLGGIYKDYKAFGFGFCMNYFEIVECIEQNGKKVLNTFSTNNRGATSMHFLMNYSINNIYNIQ